MTDADEGAIWVVVKGVGPADDLGEQALVVAVFDFPTGADRGGTHWIEAAWVDKTLEVAEIIVLVRADEDLQGFTWNIDRGLHRRDGSCQTLVGVALLHLDILDH